MLHKAATVTQLNHTLQRGERKTGSTNYTVELNHKPEVTSNKRPVLFTGKLLNVFSEVIRKLKITPPELFRQAII